jgi:phosphoesterase RecJ-like protein
MRSAIAAVVPLFQNHHRFVLTTHVNPDGDGIGSEVALADYLRRVGKQATIVNHSPTPFVYDFLDPGKTIRTYTAARDSGLIAGADAIVVMDTNHPERLRSMQDAVTASPATKICIDHHLEPSPFADHYVIDDDATSTGEITYRILLELNGAALPATIAEALYCAIMTDTGSFRYPRVDPETHRIAAHLIECGADPVAIFSRVYERWSNGRMHLLGEMLANLTMAGEGKIACVTITREMLKRTGTTEEDTDNFTTYPMSINGVRAGILFLELPSGVKISFRSRGDIPINELAKEFGGNGHRNAAGARIDGIALSRIQHDVIAAAEKYV